MNWRNWKIKPKRILLSGSIVAVALAMVIGATGAFFNDEESSLGNIFTAGGIDLQIDNTSYINYGEDGAMIPVPESTWELKDLDGELFFNFEDVKPGDLGEDTVSFHVTNNDAWLCADVAITKNDDVSSVEPELEDGDVEEDATDDFDGELAQNLNFIFWADDGDNVLEEGEQVVADGPASDALDGDPYKTYGLADSSGNIWTGLPNDPIDGSETLYLGKAWCFGEMTPAPLPQDGENTSGPDDRGPGVDCDGSTADNTAQTDSMTADIRFRAEQSRSNIEFICEPLDDDFGGSGEVPPPAPTATTTLTIIKEIINDNGGTATSTDFSFTIDGGAGQAFEADGSNELVLGVGTTTVAEVDAAGYASTISGDCDPITGEVLLVEGIPASCTITNDDIGEVPVGATLTITKTVINDNGGTATTTDFSFTINGGSPIIFEADGSNETIVAAGTTTVAEVATAGYTTTIGGDCDPTTGEVLLADSDTATCTITNDDQPATLTVTKIVTNDDGGSAAVEDFDLDVSGEPVVSGVSEEFNAGSYLVSEGPIEVTEPYQATFSGDCDTEGNITMEAGGIYTCTITNDDQAT